MPGVFIGSTELTTVGGIKVGSTDVQEVYVGATKVFPSGAPGFLPSDFADLEFWFDADDPSTITDAGGGVVSQWDDKSGNGRDISQATTSLRPSISSINGQPSLIFDGADNLFVSSLSFDNSPVTQFIVATTTTIASGISYPFTVNEVVSTANYIQRNTEAWNFIANTSSGSSSFPFLPATLAANTTNAAIARHQSATTGVVEADDGATGSDAGVGTLKTTCNEIIIGARTAAGSQGWIGHIHECGMYSQRLSDADKTTLMDYLKNKWGL